MKQIKQLTKTLSANQSVIFAYLFGSRVKGYANERSDWDIAVYFSAPPEEMQGWPAFELEAQLTRAIGSQVQVIVLNREITPLLGFQIISEGHVIADRDENIRFEFENRILRQYYDYQYFLKRQMEAEGITF